MIYATYISKKTIVVATLDEDPLENMQRLTSNHHHGLITGFLKIPRT
jgi:hypothetical protein